MTKLEQKIREDNLKKIVEDILWMAARYAHGRHTYAPGMVRDAVEAMQRMYPKWKVKPDIIIEPPGKNAYGIKTDYLDDIFNPST